MSQESKEEKLREEQIKIIQEKIIYYESLIEAIHNQSAKLILTEINSYLNDSLNILSNISLKKLEPPYYEYHKDDLQKMKALRAQIDILSMLKDSLTVKSLKEQAEIQKFKLKSLVAGEPLEARY